MSRLARDQILRRERGQGNIHFYCTADHVQDWKPYSVDPFSCYMCGYTYIHTYVHTLVHITRKRRHLQSNRKRNKNKKGPGICYLTADSLKAEKTKQRPEKGEMESANQKHLEDNYGKRTSTSALALGAIRG